ncbi:MAG: YCF48-related protein [Bacteroidota bacterium]
MIFSSCVSGFSGIRSAFFVSAVQVLTVFIASAQQWEFKNPLPTSTPLTRVTTLAPGVEVAVGDCGIVLTSSDGGATWRSGTMNTRETPGVLVSGDDLSCWALGGKFVAGSADQGRSWKVLLQDEMVPSLTDAYFPDPQHGIVIGERTVVSGITYSLRPMIMRTVDGGLTWSTEDSRMGSLSLLSFVDAAYGWLVGDALYRTTDGGATWAKTASRPEAGITGLKFFDRGHGISWSGAENRTRISITSDSGSTWIQIADTNLYSDFVSFQTDSEFWASSGYALIHTTNAGKSWATVLTSPDSRIYDLTVDGTTIIAVGNYGCLWRSTNAGQSWSQPTAGSRATLRAITFIDSTGWAVGGGGYWQGKLLTSSILKSTDRGEHWESRPSPTGSIISCVAFSDHATGWLGGDYGELLKTTDGGSQWLPVTANVYGTINQIRFLDSLNGWMVSGDGKILRTDDAGANWQEASINAPVGALTDIFMSDLMHGFAVGTGNVLLRTNDGGKNWEERGITVTFDYNGVWQIDSAKGFAAGSDGHLLRTTNGGTSWYILNMQMPTFRSIAFTGRDTGFAVGDGGGLVMTTNGGFAWSAPSSGTRGALLRVACFAGIGVFAVGENGTLLHLVQDVAQTPTAVPPAPSLPWNVVLFQNYPNPFNPSTVISGQWTSDNWVKLVVYDVLGREVAVLADGRYPAGRYTFRFDGTGRASGVYFCRLMAGAFSGVTKMVLVR